MIKIIGILIIVLPQIFGRKKPREFVYYELYCWSEGRTYLKTTVYKHKGKTWWKSEWAKKIGG